MERKPDWLPGFPVQIYCNRRDTMDEQQLQDAFSAGDEAALSAVIARYGQPLLR